MAHQPYLPNDWLDEELADVPVPAGMLARLQAVADLCQLPDDELDAWLRETAIPTGLLTRLADRANLADADLDEWLAEIPAPPGLAARLQRLALKPERPVRWAHMSAAASLLLGIAAAYLTAAGFFIQATYRGHVAANRPVLESYGADEDLSSLAAEVEISGVEAEYPQFAETEFLGPTRMAPDAELSEIDALPPLPSLPGPLEEGIVASGQAARQLLLDARYGGVFGSAQLEEDLPELHRLDGLFPRGMEPPGGPGYDLVKQQLSGFHQFVLTGSGRDWPKSVVPLGIAPASYELTRRCLGDDRLPPPEAVRTEEFLAAMNYGYPVPAKGQLALHVAGGPSPLGGPNLRLLQVGTQACQLDSPKRKPAAMTVAIDVSPSMEWSGRLEMARRAVSHLARRLQGEDRLSLVAFGAQAKVLIEDAGAADLEAIELAAAAIEAQSGTNPEGGVRLALQMTESFGVKGASRKLVLLSDGAASLAPADSSRVEGALRQAAANGLAVTVVDLCREQLPRVQNAAFAGAAGGEVLRAASADEVRWALLKALTGRSQLVAQDVELSVTFNPQVVAGYRLFGHEATLLPAATAADFHAGQSGCGLFELQLKPGGTQVATAHLKWKDPLTGQRRTATRNIQRSEFAVKSSTSAESLQLATLAAETAEWLRHSPFRDWSQPVLLRELAQQTAERLPDNASCQELAQLVQRTEHANPARNSSTKQK